MVNKKTKDMKKIYAALALFLSVSMAYSQCMTRPISLNQRVSNSSVIIEGKVISKQAFWNADHNTIFTSNLVSVSQVLKGNLNSSFVEVITIGGMIDLVKFTAEPALELSNNESGIFMLNSFNEKSQFGRPVFMSYSDQQGFIKFNADGTATEPFKTYSSVNSELRSLLEGELNRSISLFNATSGGTKFQAAAIALMPITNINPTTITAGTASQLTITGSGFGASQGGSYVAFRNADAASGTITPHATQYISWSDGQIVVQVPTKTQDNGGNVMSGTAGTGPVTVNIGGAPTVSSQTLTITHGQLNVYQTYTATPNRIFNTRHHGTNGSGGMNWRLNTSFNANTPAKNDFQTALGQWRCSTFINWQIGTTVSTATVAGDGINVVGFDNVVVPPGGALPGGVLGVCYSWYQGCITGTNVAWFVSELDLVFDDGTNWQYGAGVVGGTQFDFQSVALHELGHGHQMSHVVNASNLMHYAIGPGETIATINANIDAGGDAVMVRNLSGAVCGQSIMTALNAGNCALAAPVATFNIPTSACVGQVITLTDLSSNNPNQWTWTMTGGTPASAATQNTNTSYSTVGNKTITLVSANGTGTAAAISKTINIVASPTSAVTSGSICPGGSVSLSVSGNASSYTWNPGALTGTAQTLSPGGTTSYTVIGSNGTCTNASIGTVSVGTTPIILVSQSSTTMCVGENATITIGGANNYTTNPGAQTGTFVVVSPTLNTTYTITGNAGSACNGTNTASFVVDLCTHLADIEAENGLKLYPNPTQNVFTVKFNGSYTGNVNVFNSLGQVIIKKEVNALDTVNINLNEYPKGIYIVKINSDNNTSKVLKVIKE